LSSTLALKIILVPVLIGGITLAGRRWGQGFAGWLGSFPIVAGPVLFILALENGNVFGAGAARAALAGVAPSMVFYVVYTQLARRARWPAVVVASLLAWLATAAVLFAAALPLWVAAAVTAVALYAAPRLMPMVSSVNAQRPHTLELPARMLTGAIVTLCSSELGRLGGSSLSGYAALFPSIGLVVAAFNHAQSSADAATLFLRGMTRGMWSVAAFCLALSFALEQFSLAVAFALAILVALVTHAAFRPQRAATLRSPLLVTLVVAVSSGLLTGCATSGSVSSVREVNRQLANFTAENLELATDAETLRTRREGLNSLLAAPLSQDAAVRVALLGSPSLQALLASKSAAIASAAREGRIGNPVLNYERVRHGSEIEIGRLLSFGLLELLTLPQRQRVATAAVEAAEIELAITVIDEVTRVRQAWVRAVAAEQRQRYAARVLESAAASAELARRMEAAGNFNKMSRARQQAFEADARTQAVLARQQASSTREELVRALGLDDDHAQRLQLPERLPEIPQQSLSADAAGARLNAERVDVKLAESQWRAAAARRGLGKVTTLTDIELGLRRDPEARGYEIDVRLPLFDAGELDRRALDGDTLAAAGHLEATLRAAGSHLRESYSAYLAAYDIARHHRDELVPLRKTIAEESLLRYNGMIIGVFELLADAREQITTVMAAIDAEQQFWLAEAALQSAFAGRPAASVALGVAATKPAEAAGGY